MRLTGRNAFVTGGGTGIGRGIAHALARRGAHIAVTGRRTAPLEQVCAEAQALGSRAVFLPADLADAGERASLLPRMREALGPLDLLFHNAGVLAGGSLTALDATSIEQVIAVNLTAPLTLTRDALPELAARGGAIVFVASGMSFTPLPSACLYSATKAALRAFAESLRYEAEPLGVHVLTVYPPGTDTAMVRGMAEAAGISNHRLADPEVIGEKIVAALAAGRRELNLLGAGERALTLAYRQAPWLVRFLIFRQRRRFARMMAAAGKDGA